ncbi:MAG: hypothetical protein ABSF99_10055, partial [Anaerolineales bacterium]
VAAVVVSTLYPTQDQATTTPAVVTQAGIQTVTPLPSVKKPATNSGSLITILKFVLACLVIAVVLVGLAIFFIIRRQNRRGK